MATPEEILAKSKQLYDAGDVEGAKRLARIAKDRMAKPEAPKSDAMKAGLSELSALSQGKAPERGIGQVVYDNLIGNPSDGVDSYGEQIGRGLNDMGKAAGAGIARGAAGLADLPGMAVDAYGRAVGYGLEATGLASPELAKQVTEGIGAMSPAGRGNLARETVAAVTGGASEYKGKTKAGKFAGTVAEFLPGAMALGPKTVAGAVKYALVPGVASEAAGQATEGTKAEPWARLVASLAAPLAVSAVQAGGRALAGLPKAAADPERLKLAKVLDDFGVPITAGQRTGATALRKIEGAAGSADDVMAAQADEFTSAALKTIGVDAKRATPEVLAKAADDIGQVFDDVVKGVEVVPTPQNITASAGAIQKYKIEAPKSTVVPLIGEIHAQMVKAFRARTPIAGETLKSWRTALSRATTSADGATRAAAVELLDVVDDAMEAGLKAAGRPQDVARLSTARGQWRNLLAIEGAAAKAGENAAVGIISPARLASEVTRQGKSQWTRGTRGSIADLSRAGVAVMSPLPTVSAGGVRTVEGLSRMGGAAVGASGGAAMGSPTLAALGSVVGYAAPGAMNWLRAGPLQGIIAEAGTREGARILDPRLLNVLAQGGN